MSDIFGTSVSSVSNENFKINVSDSGSYIDLGSYHVPTSSSYSNINSNWGQKISGSFIDSRSNRAFTNGKIINLEIIALIGPIGSGKDYRALKLESEGYTKISFADYLRQTCWNTLWWKPENDLEYREFKKNPIGPAQISGREFMFSIEGLLKKAYGNNVFIEKTISHMIYHFHDKFVISDLRFIEEYNKLKEVFENIKIVFCNYKSDEYELRDVPSEKLAKRFAEIGYADGSELTQKDFDNMWAEPETML